MKYWEIIAEKLTAEGWSRGITRAYDTQAGEVFIVDAHHSETDGRFIVKSDELLTAFVELEQVTKGVLPLCDRAH